MARNRSRDDESLLLRSAESLGRLIGSLQRQLEIATGRLAAVKPTRTGARKPPKAKGGARKKKSASATTTRTTSRRPAGKTKKST